VKCSNILLYRKVKVKKFKNTLGVEGEKSRHLQGKRVYIVDKCINGSYVYVKRKLTDLYFYKIHRKDLARIK